jgi:hypothetical protein
MNDRTHAASLAHFSLSTTDTLLMKTIHPSNQPSFSNRENTSAVSYNSPLPSMPENTRLRGIL